MTATVITDLTPESAGWTYSGLRIVALDAGDTYVVDTADTELIAVPLNGSCSLSTSDGDRLISRAARASSTVRPMSRMSRSAPRSPSPRPEAQRSL